MKTYKEMEVKDLYGKVVSAQIREDGTCKLIIEVEDEEPEDILIEASKLSLDDRFMQYEPNSNRPREVVLKKSLIEIIQKGISDFYRLRIDPSFTEGAKNICYVTARMPAIGKPYTWWRRIAKEFNPERGSRLGTKSEYIAFLGVLIKSMVANGYEVSDAWRQVCNDSKKLGHYWNSAGSNLKIEFTGSRPVCRFYDLANTEKILLDDKDSDCLWVAGGAFFSLSYNKSLFCLDKISPIIGEVSNAGVGWIVYER